MIFMEVSAKDGRNISEVFDKMAREMKKLLKDENSISPSNPLVSGKPAQKNCCK